jgi:hypothetical protein
MQTDLLDTDAFQLDKSELGLLSDFRLEVDHFNGELDKVAAKAYNPVNQQKLLEHTAQIIASMLSSCKEIDRTFHNRTDMLKKVQEEFRTKTNRNFQQSFFMNRARTWPQGYPETTRHLNTRMATPRCQTASA